MQAGRPNELIASIAARQVRPGEKHVVDDDHGSLLERERELEALTTGSSARVPTSSRCIETSITPVATRTFSIASMSAAIRRAISTPRDGIPARTSAARSRLRSMISCAIRRKRAAHRFRIEDADRGNLLSLGGFASLFLRDLTGSP